MQGKLNQAGIHNPVHSNGGDPGGQGLSAHMDRHTNNTSLHLHGPFVMPTGMAIYTVYIL